ncbi:hypothetical protein PVL29_003396 [Vitis rotundifolia]|uniref:Phytosulfokine n=1 Tax=Vitis rotundifolia TaxID=103349 RepID=A0AA39E523_VITRO|nr:hypothetical protein PVL29_003396 [Vitis rotundifolia]
MSSKLTSLFIIASLLFFTLSCQAARPGPSFSDVTPMKIQHGDVDEAKKVEVKESCEGVGEEECLMKRTLAAQTDYIYTQNKNP